MGTALSDRLVFLGLRREVLRGFASPDAFSFLERPGCFGSAILSG
jgi:hypothetical protein